tara:strand:+ start:367 stop:1341 length:975 start_codon:yes stop_codon:yes gene_type:complete
MKDNLIIYVSSRNNYNMLEHEVLKNINREGFEFINVDDRSIESEKEYGKEICKKNNITFLDNKSSGVQMATQTVVDFVNENRPNCKWLICFQHDIWPISKDFFTRISQLIEQDKLNEFGSIGFNIVDHGDYTKDAWDRFQKGEKPIGMIGFAHLGVSDNSNRWLAIGRNSVVDNKPELFKKPFICEFPQWPSIGINVEKWNNCIQPDPNYEFHLWYPDIAMQFNYHNYPVLILPNLYCFNHQRLKEKYGLNYNSATGAMQGDEMHFGQYGPHLKNWKEKWGWDYENVLNTFTPIKQNYVGTLIHDYFHHDIQNGPFKTYDLGKY